MSICRVVGRVIVNVSDVLDRKIALERRVNLANVFTIYKVKWCDLWSSIQEDLGKWASAIFLIS